MRVDEGQALGHVTGGDADGLAIHQALDEQVGQFTGDGTAVWTTTAATGIDAQDVENGSVGGLHLRLLKLRDWVGHVPGFHSWC
jgi:hypothetical protein